MNESPNVDKRQKEESFDYVGLFLDYLTNWKWFLLSVIIFGIGTYYYVARIIPTYNVSASIYLNDDKAINPNQFSLEMNNPLMDQMNVIDETEIEILKSKNNLINIVDSLGLSYAYYLKGELRDTPNYRHSAIVASLDSVNLVNLETPIEITVSEVPEGFEINARCEHLEGVEEKTMIAKSLPADVALSEGVVKLSKSPLTNKLKGTEKIIINNPRTVAANLAENLVIEPAENAPSILRLSLNTPLIDEGRDILNVLVEFYNRQMLEEKNMSAIQTEAFILDRLVMINGELKDVENRLRKYREEHNVSDLQAQTSMNLAQLNSTEGQLASVDADMEILKEIEKQVRQQDSYSQLPSFSNSDAVTKSIDTYNHAVINYQRALESMGEEHPRVGILEEELIKQKAQILGNINVAKNEVSARRRGIIAIDNRSSGQLAVQPSVDKGLNEIFREQQVKVNIYTFLLQKREEIALQKTLATPTAKFIDNPVGKGPVAPRRILYYAMGILLGLLLPAGIIYLRRLLFPKFVDKDELERVTSVPIVGEICVCNEADGNIVVGEGVSTPIAELFRLLRNNINFIGGAEREKKVIVVTSSVAGEGKTFVASNLAATLALTGKRTVIVGLDIRRPMLSHIFGVSNRQGVTTYLSGQEDDIEKLIAPTDINENLFILPAGPVAPNPNELLLSKNMTRMMEDLRDKFDYVIIDSAPIGLISDTFLVIPHSDVQLYVTRAGVSTRKGLGVLHDAVRNNRMPHVYIVLNGVKMQSSAYTFRRYGYYGHDSKHSYGYASKTPKRKKWFGRKK